MRPAFLGSKFSITLPRKLLTVSITVPPKPPSEKNAFIPLTKLMNKFFPFVKREAAASLKSNALFTAVVVTSFVPPIKDLKKSQILALMLPNVFMSFPKNSFKVVFGSAASLSQKPLILSLS